MREWQRPLWLVVSGLGITQIIGWGTTYYALGALSPDIAVATGWSPTLIFGAFSAALLLSALISRRSGHLVDRWGGRRAMVVGSMLCAAGTALMGLVAHPFFYIAGWLILAPGMRLATYDAAFASLSQMAGVRTRRSISYLSLFGGLASTAFWPIGHWLGQKVGWQNTFLIYAALHLMVCMPLHGLLLKGQQAEQKIAAENAEEYLKGRERILALAIFSGVLALNGFVFAAISAHVLPLLGGLGLTAAQAVTLAALIGPSQVASRMLEIAIGKRWPAAMLSLVAFGLLPVSLLLALVGKFSFTAIAAFVLLYGASNGLVTIAKGVYPLALFGPAHYGRTLGTLTAPSLFFNAAAPLVMAYIMTIGGSQLAMAVCLAVAALSGMGMLWLAHRHKST
jgi:predicted MFS family arabinose efflux permease